MNKIRSARPFCALLIGAGAILAVMAIGSGRAAAALALPLQLEAAVSPTGGATAPAQAAVEAVTAPVQKVAEEVTRPAKMVVEAVPKSPTSPSALGPPKVTADPATEAGDRVKQVAGAVVGAARGPETSAPVPSAVVEAVDATSGATTPIEADPPAFEGEDDRRGAEEASVTSSPPAQPGSPAPNTFVPAPTDAGSTAAPLPRWVAYVWPAVALADPYLRGLADDWRQALSHLSAGAAGEPQAGQGVAGVHASGGRSASDGSSPSLFQKLPGDVAHAFSDRVPTSALTYLCLLALAVLALAVVVHWEMAAGRRERGR
jgi:hypothetical protein